MEKEVIKIQPVAQNYAWGKIGSDSMVARLLPDCEQKPYAELWIGAHPKSPAKLIVNGEASTLDKVIAAGKEELLGKGVAERFGQLPFLFKILSIAEPLSIQAHPDKSLAEKLHASDPEHYPDDNHKPEIAIAITEVELLYGFRTDSEIESVLNEYPEIKSLTGEFSEIKKVFTSVLRSSSEELKVATDSLKERLASKEELSPADKWFLKTAAVYTEGDPGLFSFYIMNLTSLKPGEASYIGANIPHAYLSGDLAECMANSDNVVRAGLTPKFKDIDTLCEMLTYEQGPVEIVVPKKLSEGLIYYPCPLDEFQIQLPEVGKKMEISESENASIVFCEAGAVEVLSGNDSLLLTPGQSAFLPAGLSCSVQVTEGKSYRVVAP